MSVEPASSPSGFGVGDRVRLATVPPYLKTADPMPMLRPPSVVPVGAEGLVQAAKLADTWAVRFDTGTFLVDGKYLVAAAIVPVEQVSDVAAEISTPDPEA